MLWDEIFLPKTVTNEDRKQLVGNDKAPDKFYLEFNDFHYDLACELKNYLPNTLSTFHITAHEASPLAIRKLLELLAYQNNLTELHLDFPSFKFRAQSHERVCMQEVFQTFDDKYPDVNQNAIKRRAERSQLRPPMLHSFKGWLAQLRLTYAPDNPQPAPSKHLKRD